MSFVHLHVHSEYSMLDGLSRIPRLVQTAKEMGMPAIALTDHGAMFGVVEFYRAAKAAGIKPIIGIETYLSQRGMRDRDPKLDARTFHLLLLAENDAGYKNLLKIATASQLEGFYYRPRIDHEFLAQHSDGLICSTGCLSGEIPRALQEGRHGDARKLADWYVQVFGRERFLFEVQDHDIPELPGINKHLVELAERYQGRVVATNDVHYVRQEDAALQDILLCIQTNSIRSDPDRLRMTDPTYYLRSPEEMKALLGDIPGALENTLWVAERCGVDLDSEGYRLPNFEVPEGHTPKSYLRELCLAGLSLRYGPRHNEPELRDRLEYELNIIHQMGFDTYFLIVWDLCRFSKEQGIWYNARGSAAGSIVAYSLDITLVDPIEHGLIFERFLNPSRVSMPDIDLDFQDDKRQLMLEYTARKYGQNKVAQIITFGTLGARAAIRDVGRVLDIPLPEVDRLAKEIPNIPGKPTTIPEVLEKVPSFKQYYDQAPYLRDLIDTAASLEGVVRNPGTHAAGVIISDRDIIEYVPLHRPTGSSQEESSIRALTQFEMQILDSLGLLKVDFLGLSTLTVMERACALIRQRHGVGLDIHSIPLDDPVTYELLGRGEVLGVFQVEGAGMRRYLMEMKPRELANVIAMVALYRPGPIEFIPDYIRRMQGAEEVSYLDDSLEPIFEETYGIPVYQEQIMLAAMNLAGYSAAEADSLRKAIAKKKAAGLETHRSKFIKGAVDNGMLQKTAAAIFHDWENFARYGFNKAHAADYGVIAVQTAYLKAHYPLEYMTALLSVFKHDTDKVALYVADCRRMGIDVLPPDVNASGLDFTIEDREGRDPAIRFGLAAVKNVGEGAAERVLEAREEHGAFPAIGKFARRVDLRSVGKRALEALVRVGAMDGLGSRLALLESLDMVLGYSSSHFRAAEIGQMSLFSAATGVSDSLALPPPAYEVSRRQLLAWEKENLGVYASDHPLSPYMDDLTRVVSHFSAELADAEQRQEVCVAGMVCHVRPHHTRRGQEMAYVALEDLQGNIELVVFPSVWKKVMDWLKPDMVVVANGRADRSRGDPCVLVDQITADLERAVQVRPRSTEAEAWPVPPERRRPKPQASAAGSPDASGSPGAEQAPSLEGGTGGDGASGASGLGLSEVRGTPFLAGLSEDTTSLARAPTVTPPPLAWDQSLGRESRLVTIVLRSTGDRERDQRRIRRVHGLLTSYPGNDLFSFHIQEASRDYLLEFPSSSTGYCQELHHQLSHLLGEGCVGVKPLRPSHT